MSGSGSRANLSDKDLVESVLRELSEAADKWEALVAQAEAVTYSVDLGDVYAVANSDGRLLKLTLHPGVMTGYGHGELADRLNLAITALREEAEAETGRVTAAPCTDVAYALIARARLTGPPRWSYRSHTSLRVLGAHLVATPCVRRAGGTALDFVAVRRAKDGADSERRTRQKWRSA